MAAIMGGTQSLHTNALDEAIALPTEFSGKLARTTQLILQTETGIPDIIDPFAGSFAIESLTNELCEKAMEILEEIDGMGGMVEAVEAGICKQRIEESAARRQAAIDSGSEVIVGVNKFVSEEGEEVETLKIDNAAVRQQQIDRINQVKAERDTERVEKILAKLRDVAARSDCPSADMDTNLLALSVEAARARATVGEISEALAGVWGRHQPKDNLISGAYSGSFKGGEVEETLKMVDGFEEKFGRRPRILVAKLGQDGHDRGAKVIASGFSDMGFDVDIGPLFQTPEEVAKQVSFFNLFLVPF